MNVVIHIEKLVLDGVDLGPQQQAALQRDLIAGLARLVVDGRTGAVGNVALAGNSLGLQVANAVYGAMVRLP